MDRKANLIRLLIQFVVLALLGAACASPATTTPRAQPTSQLAPTLPPPSATANAAALGADLDAMFQNMTKAGAFSGAVLLAKDGQTILSQGYGYADRDQKIPNTPHTKFFIASMTSNSRRWRS